MGDEPFEFNGVIYWIIEAYKNLKKPGKFQPLSPEKFASELIRLSFHEQIGYCLIAPATKHMHKQYDDGEFWPNIPCEYLCRFRWEDEEKWDMELTVAGFGDENIQKHG